MTKTQRILALDAAIESIRGFIKPEQQKILDNLIDDVIGADEQFPLFGDFIEQQRAAVIALASDEHVFGK